MNKLLLYILGILWPITGLGQTSIHLTIKDQQTGRYLQHARVENRQSMEVFTTDERGITVFKAAKGDSISIVHLDFQDSIFLIKDYSDLQIALNPLASTAANTWGNKAYKRLNSGQDHRIPISFLKSVPPLFGEPDILKSLCYLPGVQPLLDGYNHLMVRGGNPGQTLISYDGANLYFPYHYAGFMSVFQPEMIGSVDLYKADWPSKFGGRQSAVVDIRSAEGNYQTHQQSYQLGLMGFKGNFKGPLMEDKLTYHAGIRRTLFDPFTHGKVDQIRDHKKHKAGADFQAHDLHLRTDWRINKNQHLSLTGLYAKDDYDFADRLTKEYFDESYGIKNKLLALNYRYHPKNETSINMHLSQSKFSSSLDLLSESTLYFPSLMEDYHANYRAWVEQNQSLKTTKLSVYATQSLANNMTLSYGTEVEWLTYKDEQNSNIFSEHILGSQFSKNKLSTSLAAAFAEFSFKLAKRLQVNTGLRLTSYEDREKVLLDPKISLQYALNQEARLTAGFSLNSQPIVPLIQSYEGLISETHYLADPSIPVAISNQWSIGLFHARPRFFDQLAIEAYYKTQKEVSKYALTETNHFVGEIDYSPFFNAGEMKAYGLEILLQKSIQQLSASLSYAYSKAETSFPKVNSGDFFDADFSKNHHVNALFAYQFSKGYRLSASWTYESGIPISSSSNPFINTIIPSYNSFHYKLNDAKTSARHHLDLNVERRWNAKKRGTNWFGLGIYNVYNQSTVFSQLADHLPGRMNWFEHSKMIPHFYVGMQR